MKLLIEIDKETYSGIKDLCILAKYIDNTIKAILDGTPLEEIPNPCIECSQNCCVRELNGEKVDVIRYYDDPEKLLYEAIKPAVPKNVRIDNDERRIYFEVSEDDVAIAIGKRGLNAKLTSRMMNWRLDISKEDSPVHEDFEDKLGSAVAGLSGIPGIDDQTAQELVKMGFTDIDTFEGVKVDDLVDAGFDEEKAKKILDSIQNFHRK